MRSPSLGLTSASLLLAAGLLLVGPTGCTDTDHLPRQGAVTGPDEPLREVLLPLEPPCTVNVEGSGAIHIEDEYVANVVACENGNAPMEALKAQAVQARGYLYYVMLVTGRDTIRDSQQDQVFSCTYTTAGPRHYEAARATRGQYLAWNNQIVAPFYVAGAIPANPNDGPPAQACHGAGGNDPTTTQQWVTYNQGLAGCGITMTPLGWVPDDCTRNPQNRGCASQNGQACLARRGWFYQQMMPYHYGEDIELRQAQGTCGAPSTQPPNYDAYCMNHSEPSYCVDATQRVLCSGDEATAVEDCTGGCLLGECLPPPVEPEVDACDGLEDGWHCADDDHRFQCDDGATATTETCTLGCAGGRCLSPPGTDPEEPGPDPADPSDPNDASRPGPSGPAGPLITVSQGVTSGCSHTPDGPATPALFLLFALGTLLLRRPGVQKN